MTITTSTSKQTKFTSKDKINEAEIKLFTQNIIPLFYTKQFQGPLARRNLHYFVTYWTILTKYLLINYDTCRTNQLTDTKRFGGYLKFNAFGRFFPFLLVK